MPARPRKDIVREDQVGYYHCYNRCVRRSFLCGVDPQTGDNYEHRKGWIQQRLEELAGAFAVEVCGFSVLDNHLHTVLRNRPDLVAQWPDQEVARRWWQLCPLRRDEQGQPAEPQDVELNLWLSDAARMSELRKRLSSISWFMKLLCENIARRANREDGVSGKFWEERFKSVPLLDEEAILACSMYVDLNPIRAAKAETPETSQYTSAYERIQSWRRCQTEHADGLPDAIGQTGSTIEERAEAELWLIPVSLASASVSQDAATLWNPFPARRASNRGFLSLALSEYLQLLDWTGRQLRKDKQGTIPAHLLPILERLKLDAARWPKVVAEFPRLFRSAAGRAEQLMREARRRGRRWLQGVRCAAMAFG